MQIINKNVDLDCFFESLRASPHSLLLLDYDGTLAPFHVDPSQAFPYPGIPEVLNKLVQLPKTRTVLISGRGIHDLIPLLGMEPLPEIWGSHGGERLDHSHGYTHAPLSSTQLKGIELGWSSVHQIPSCPRLEKKPFSIAVHWRGSTDQAIETLKREVKKEWEPIAVDHELVIHSFNGGLELRPKGVDKGIAIDAFLREQRFDGHTPIAYLGDDATDEDAFARLGPLGLKILVGNTPKPTLADIQISPPGELLEFLNTWIEYAGTT